MIYNKLSELIKAVREHTKLGYKVISADNPAQLLLGWHCPTTKQDFNLKVSALISDKVGYSKYLISHAGREEFVKYLNWEKLKL